MIPPGNSPVSLHKNQDLRKIESWLTKEARAVMFSVMKSTKQPVTGCAILVWVGLKQVAQETQPTIYRVKHDLLPDYLRQQLKSPVIKMSLV